MTCLWLEHIYTKSKPTCGRVDGFGHKLPLLGEALELKSYHCNIA